GRRLITSYLTVPAYAEFHRWLGRDGTLGPMWDMPAQKVQDRGQARSIMELWCPARVVWVVLSPTTTP
ncbi:hypothetical protein ABZ272_27320, partial [Micromonospora sp. NPDC005979]